MVKKTIQVLVVGLVIFLCFDYALFDHEPITPKILNIIVR